MSNELIYLVEDDKNMQELIKFNLIEMGYRVNVFDDGESLLSAAKASVPDLFIIDILLPGIDGLAVCLKLRENFGLHKIPVIFLTVKSDEIEKLVGFEIGGDDYITKPFSIKELCARIKAIFRRQYALEDDGELLKIQNLSIDFSRNILLKDNIPVELSYKEFELLKTLILHKWKVLSREILLEKIWGFDFNGDPRTVDVHIRNLRKKIEVDDSNPRFIETIRGIGYRFNDI